MSNFYYRYMNRWVKRERMTKLIIMPNQNLPKRKHSRERIWFKCSCGNVKQISWKNYNTNHTKSCGECRSNKFQLLNLKDKNFGKLAIDLNQQFPNKITKRTKLNWLCECGSNKIVCAGSVVNNLTKSCGCLLKEISHKWEKPTLISKEKWLKHIPSLIDDNLPDKWSCKSSKRVKFKCDCGNVYVRRFCKYKKNSTCQKCDFITKEKFLKLKFGKLTPIDINLPDEFHIRSYKKFWFKCDCGNKKQIVLSAIKRGYTTTCGNCNNRSKDWWEKQKFGRLVTHNFQFKSLKTGSEKLIKFKCSCDNIAMIRAYHATTGKTHSCGSCKENYLQWWIDKPKLIKTKYGYALNILQDYFKNYSITPLNGVNSTLEDLNCICNVCGNRYITKLAYLLYSHVVSCGCLSGQISKANIEIGQFIESLGIKAYYGSHEKKLTSTKVDVFVESHKLIIEHHGLRYHNEKSKNKNYDYKKYEQHISAGYKYLIIYEDEWRKKNSLFKNLLRNTLKLANPQFKLRPQKCSIKLVTNRDTSPILDEYHYIGKSSAKHHIGVYYNNVLIACMLIKKPTRQNSGDWEIIRMVCNPDYRIYGIWSYLIRWAQSNLKLSGQLISFSDNRLFSGNVYENLGMAKVGEVKSDYYWVKGNNRFHKSGLRKNKIERMCDKTETELRSAQGYHKIWDYGKTKWALTL